MATALRHAFRAPAATMLTDLPLVHPHPDDAVPGEASATAGPALPRIAFDWLQDVLQGAFADPSPPPPAPPAVDEPDWDGRLAG